MTKILSGIIPELWQEDVTVLNGHIDIVCRCPVAVTGKNRSDFIETVNWIEKEIKKELGDNVLSVEKSVDGYPEMRIILRKDSDG